MIFRLMTILRWVKRKCGACMCTYAYDHFVHTLSACNLIDRMMLVLCATRIRVNDGFNISSFGKLNSRHVVSESFHLHLTIVIIYSSDEMKSKWTNLNMNTFGTLWNSDSGLVASAVGGVIGSVSCVAWCVASRAEEWNSRVSKADSWEEKHCDIQDFWASVCEVRKTSDSTAGDNLEGQA